MWTCALRMSRRMNRSICTLLMGLLQRTQSITPIRLTVGISENVTGVNLWLCWCIQHLSGYLTTELEESESLNDFVEPSGEIIKCLLSCSTTPLNHLYLWYPHFILSSCYQHEEAQTWLWACLVIFKVSTCLWNTVHEPGLSTSFSVSLFHWLCGPGWFLAFSP